MVFCSSPCLKCPLALQFKKVRLDVSGNFHSWVIPLQFSITFVACYLDIGIRSPSAWSYHNFNNNMYGHSLSPPAQDPYPMVHAGNPYGPLGVPVKSPHESPLPVQTYHDPRMFGNGAVAHNRGSPTNSNEASSPPNSLSNTYHTDQNANITGISGAGPNSPYPSSGIHPNPSHSFMGTNSVTINNNYLMNVSPSGNLNLPPMKGYSTPNGISRTMEEESSVALTSNQFSFYRTPPTLYETPGGMIGYQNSIAIAMDGRKHGYEHMTDQNGNITSHPDDLDENGTAPKGVWRPY